MSGYITGFPHSSVGKESPCNAGDPSSIPRLGRSPGEGKGYPLQYSGLEDSMDYIVHGVTKSWTRLSDCHFHLSIHQLKDILVASKSWQLWIKLLSTFTWIFLLGLEFSVPLCKYQGAQLLGHMVRLGLPGWLRSKELTCHAEDVGDSVSSIPG